MKTSLCLIFSLGLSLSASADISTISDPFSQIELAKQSLTKITTVGDLLAVVRVLTPSPSKDCDASAWQFQFVVSPQFGGPNAKVTVYEQASVDTSSGVLQTKCILKTHFVIQDQNFPTDTAAITATQISQAVPLNSVLPMAEKAGITSVKTAFILNTTGWPTPSRLTYFISGPSGGGQLVSIKIDALTGELVAD